MADGANQPRPAQSGGFNCPRCQAFIAATLVGLLGSPGVSCGECGLELRLDLERSAEALTELRKLAAGTDEARRMLDQAGASPPGRD